MKIWFIVFTWKMYDIQWKKLEFTSAIDGWMSI